MDKKNIQDKLTDIFKDVFDDDNISISDDTTADDIDDWDSLSQIRIIATIEKEFSIKFAFEEVASLNNVGDMIKIIEDKKRMR